MPFYLYWDESAKTDGSKLVRSTYSSLEEAMAQAEADIQCRQCDGSGKENSAWGPQTCRVCEGSGESYSRAIVCIEESDSELSGSHRSTIQRGTKVWEPKKR